MHIRTVKVQDFFKSQRPNEQLLLIVRSPVRTEKGLILPNNENNFNTSARVIWMPELSPSRQLFFDYRNWASRGIWNEVTFRSEYAPRFISEIANNPVARKLLNQIYTMNKQNIDRNFALGCYCDDESLCHRSIVAGLLQGIGINVETKDNADYSDFFEDFRVIRTRG